MHPRRFSRRSLMAAGFGVTVGAAAASLLAACGEDEAESETMTETTTSDGGQRETVTIEYLNWAFSELGKPRPLRFWTPSTRPCPTSKWSPRTLDSARPRTR